MCGGNHAKCSIALAHYIVAINHGAVARMLAQAHIAPREIGTE